MLKAGMTLLLIAVAGQKQSNYWKVGEQLNKQ